jgi:RNA polymerase sigma factor (sigma-70 family)
VSLEEVEIHAAAAAHELLELDEALRKLEAMDARKAKIVELRFFMGLSIDEAALALSVSPETVKRDWRLAKAWLWQELSNDRSK